MEIRLASGATEADIVQALAGIEDVTVRDGRGTAIRVVNSVNAEVTVAVVKNMLT